jgi:uncharacterized surface protein with fasciclin (FAS1) repeats
MAHLRTCVAAMVVALLSAACVSAPPGVNRQALGAMASAAASGNAATIASSQHRHAPAPLRRAALTETTPRVLPPASVETIAGRIAATSDSTIFAAAMRAAGLAPALDGPGEFTVFAPSNAAFDRLPPGAVEALLERSERRVLRRTIAYHIVTGRLSYGDLGRLVDQGGGAAILTTASGGVLRVSRTDGGLALTDELGVVCRIATRESAQSNGVIHQVDGVLSPR